MTDERRDVIDEANKWRDLVRAVEAMEQNDFEPIEQLNSMSHVIHSVMMFRVTGEVKSAQMKMDLTVATIKRELETQRDAALTKLKLLAEWRKTPMILSSEEPKSVNGEGIYWPVPDFDGFDRAMAGDA